MLHTGQQVEGTELDACACMQGGTPAKNMASARGNASVPKENVPANTGTAARATVMLRPKAGASDTTVADLTEQVNCYAKLILSRLESICMHASSCKYL